jgi:hypothetical protein
VPPIRFPCPVCGLNLGNLDVSPPPQTNVTADAAVGSHVHYLVTGTAQCNNGHQWQAADGFLLRRIS